MKNWKIGIFAALMMVLMLAGFLPAGAFSPSSGTVIEWIGTGKLSEGQTTYDLREDTADVYTLTYTTDSIHTADNIVLVLSCLDYGQAFKTLIDHSVNAHVVDAAWLNKEHTMMALKLEPLNTSTSISIQMETVTIALTQQQCISWMDNGTLPATGLTAKEYSHTGTAATVLTGGTLLDTCTFGSLTPAVYNNVPLKNNYWYNVGVSSLQQLADRMLGNMTGSYGTTNHVIFGPQRDPYLHYDLISTHSEKMPLIEITGIKVYVPENNPNISLVGVGSIVESVQTTGNYLLWAKDFTVGYRWNDWVVGTRQTDGTGAYYIITPPGNQRVFNNGTDTIFGTLKAGMKLVWSVTADLPNSSTSATLLQGADTQVFYQIPSGSSTPVQRTYTHIGPQFHVWARNDSDTIYHGYFDNLSKGIPATRIVGATYSNDFTYTTNGYMLTKPLEDTYTENISAYDGPAVQTYDFPFEIQPRKIWIGDYNTHAPGTGGNDNFVLLKETTDLAKVSYTLLDTTTYEFTANQIAEINETLKSKGADDHGMWIDLEHWSETNPVKQVIITWNHLRTEQRRATNVNSPRGMSYGGQVVATAVVKFNYWVSPIHQDGSDVLKNEAFQVLYDFSTDGTSPVSHSPSGNEKMTPGKNYMWFKLLPTQDVLFYGKDGKNRYYTIGGISNPQIMDGDENTSALAEDIGLYVGIKGQRQDILENPEITLYIENGKQVMVNLAGKNGIPMTNNERLIFFSGQFTAPKALSDWTFTYDLYNKKTGETSAHTYTVPTLTEDTIINLEHNEGEYFTALSLKYSGSFNTGHPSDTPNSFLDSDTDEYLILIKNMMLRNLKENPFNGKPFNTNTDYQYAEIDVRGYATWDNCVCEDEIHHTKQDMVYAASKTGGMPAVFVCFDQYVWLTGDFIPAVNYNNKTIYQGDNTNSEITFTVNHTKNSPSSSTLNMSPRVLPWDIAEAAYIELTDSSFFIDFSRSSFYGHDFTSGNVEYEYVSINGKNYLKINFVDNFIRGGGFLPDKTVRINIGPARYNLAGIISLFFSTVPSIDTGTHYPIGKVYLDFSQLLDDYDAHTDPESGGITGAKDGITKYYFEGANLVEDTLGLSGSKTGGPKLWEYDFSKNGATPYRVDVLYAGGLHVNLMPGKKGIWDYDRITEFQTHEKDELRAMVSLSAPDTKKVYDLNTYIYIPHKDHEITYEDENQIPRTIRSDFDMYLRGIPQILNQSGQGVGTVTYYYTTDLEPNAGSGWQALTAASTANWGDAQWRAVRGLRIHVDEMDYATKMDLQLDLGCDGKATLDVISAYSSGSYDYKYDRTESGPFQTVHLGKSEWRYNTYTVTEGTNTRVWFDVYDENGVQDGEGETAAQGVTVELYDTDGTTLVDSAVTDAGGGFTLRSWNHDAGQVMKIVLPVTGDPKDPASGSAKWKLTAQSTAGISALITDSDFNRENHSLVLPPVPANGINNISAGLVRLPELSTADIEMNIGESKSLEAVLRDWLGEAKNDSSYNIIFFAADDPQIADATGGNERIEAVVTGKEHSNTRSVTVQGLRPGKTKVKIMTQNKLGDVTEIEAKITVKMTYVDVSVKKIWEDNNDEFGIRLQNAAVQLRRTSPNFKEDAGKPVMLSGPEWTHTFTNLEEYDSHGAAFTYSVEEIPAVNLKNYKVEYGGSGNFLTVTNTLQTISYEGEKIWEENGNGFTRPDSITINLYRSDKPDEVIDSLVLQKAEDSVKIQTFKFEDLLQYAPDGSEYTYTVREDSIPEHYAEIVDGQYIINVFDLHVFDFLKEWDHTGAPEDQRPASVTIDIFRDDETDPFETFELTKAGDWKYLRDIPSTEIEGHRFTIVEEPAAGYRSEAEEPVLEDRDGDNINDAILFKLKNTYIMPKVTVSGTKAWENLLEGVEPPVVNITLYRSSSNVPEEKIGETAIYINDKTYEFSDLDRYDSRGNEFTYRVEETPPAGYISTHGDPVVDPQTGNVTIDLTNTYSPDPVSVTIPVTKLVHEEEAFPAEFTFTLESEDGEKSDVLMIETDGDGEFTGEFASDFLLFDRPGTYVFTVREEAGDAEGFVYDEDSFIVTVTVRDSEGMLKTSIDYIRLEEGEEEHALNVHFINTWKKPVISVYGEKIWENVPEDFQIPNAVIKLYRGDETEQIDMVTLIYAETEFDFDGLDKYDAEGNLYTYRVEEEPLSSFESEYSDPVIDEAGDILINITNRYTAPEPCRHDPPVKKIITGLEEETDAVFTFVLKPKNHSYPMPEGHNGGSKEVSITGAGEAEFGIIEFTEEGIYEYAVTETAGDEPGFTYDGTKFTIRYEVTNDDGHLQAVRTFYKDGEEVEEMAWAVFTNNYESDEPEPEPEPEPDYPHFFRLEELPRTGFPMGKPTGLSAQPLSVNYRPSGLTLQLPSLDVSVPVVTVPYTDGGYPVEWLGSEAGLLEGSARPGEGCAVLTGHNHLSTEEAGPFALLRQLRKGDVIFLLDEQGALKAFTVYASEKIGAYDSAALERIAVRYAGSLTLLTCEDESVDGGYASRRVVAARPR